MLGAPFVSPARSRVGASPLVGRERELAVLEDALAMATEGQFQVVGVVGEAGVGKSRLCEEFAESCRDGGVTVRRTTGVSHGRDVPLLPILAFYRQYFGIIDSDDPASARRKVTERLLDLDPNLHEALPLIFDFLEVADRPLPPMAPEVRMRRIFDVVRRVTARRSERETLVLIFEDLHWFDPQSETFLERLVESFPGSRTLVVTNYRPEFSARWMRHSYYRQMPLTPLHETALSELLGGLLGMDFSLAPLLGFVQERTGGNPFFVEEVVRALIEDGTLAGEPARYHLARPLQEVKVPPSVQAVLAARIDRLPAQYKAVLETASAIGRTFGTAVLAQVAKVSSDALEDSLSALCAAELLQETGQTAGEYRFWHALTQEVAYGSLLAERRRQLHAAVADALAEGESDRLEELSAVIAWHWDRAENHLRAAQWNMRAGAWALRTDLAEAERRWRAAIDLLARAPETRQSAELGVRARIRLIQWGGRRGADPAELERLLEEGRSLAERSADIGLQAMLTYVWGSSRTLIGDVQGGLAGWIEGARLAETTGDGPLISALAPGPILGLTLTGPLEEALSWSERALRFCDDPDLGASLIGYSPLVRTLSFRADVFIHLGRLAQAKDEAEKTIAMARARREPELLAWALTVAPQVAWLTGETIDTVDSAAEAIRVGEDAGNPLSVVLGLKALAVAQLVRRDAGQAAAAADRALSLGRSRHTGLIFEAEILAYLAYARVGECDHGGARSAAAEAVAVAERQGARVAECLARVAQAHVSQATGEDEAAVVSGCDGGLTAVRETGAVTYEPFFREQLGRLQGDEKELWEALHLYRQIGATGHARRLAAELSAGSVRAEGEARHGQ